MVETPHHATVSVAFAREALRCVAEQGHPTTALLRAAGIPAAVLAASQGRIAVESFGQLWLDIAATLDDEFFGLDTRRMKVGTYAALCRMAIRCSTLGEALKTTARWINLILDESRITLERHGRDAALCITDEPRARAPHDRNRAYAHETLLVLLLGLGCWLIERRIPIHDPEFSYPRPARAAEYDAVFAPGGRFDATVTRVPFAASVLRAAVVQNTATLRTFLRGAPANFIQRYRNERSTAARVREQLQATPPGKQSDFVSVARRLGAAPSTLHRHLAREGTRFGAIRDAVLRDQAIQRLATTNDPINAIAEGLG
ncbi:MAG TPA: AraC family transcriptional regulator ligand-binding domain-containing protein, partial [Nevskiaceae bacterium]|nr:AraC family transcriptional regulator ligand-binding domain-containing protein [Nevskiaceae bacterium]